MPLNTTFRWYFTIPGSICCRSRRNALTSRLRSSGTRSASLDFGVRRNHSLVKDYLGAGAMRKQETELFTPAEAAVLSRLSLKAVNNAIDKKTVTARRTRAGRLLDEPALVYLSLERQLAGDTTPEFRRRLFAEIAAEPRRRVVSVGALKVDIGESRREVMERLKQLRRAERLVTVNPEIMGGNPVFRGTRVPVHQVAELLAKGETVERLCE